MGNPGVMTCGKEGEKGEGGQEVKAEGARSRVKDKKATGRLFTMTWERKEWKRACEARSKKQMLT